MKLCRLALLGVMLSVTAYSQDHSADELYVLSHSPGSYTNDTWLEVTPISQTAVISFRFSEDGHFLPLSRALHLTSMSGEQRLYPLELRIVDGGKTVGSSILQYAVDKRPPVAPTFDPEPGTYVGAVHISIESADDALVEYTVDRPLSFEPEIYTGTAVAVSAVEGAAITTLRARAVDAAGNRSVEAKAQYTVLSPGSVGSDMEVRSPVAGSFANAQLLYVDAPSDWEVLYSIGRLDPTVEGTPYTQPQLIPGEGEILLRVAARAPGGAWRTREVEYTQHGTDPVSVRSGTYTEPVSIAPPEGRLRYTLEDRLPTAEDPVLRDPISLMPISGLLRHVVLRFLDDDGAQYRYVFVLEGRAPGQVDTVVDQTGTTARIRMSARPGARIRYEISGLEGEIAGTYSEPIVLSLPEGRPNGSFVVVGSVVLSSGVQGPPARREVLYDTEVPASPQVELVPVGSGLRISYASPTEASVRYELDSSSVTRDSPVLVNGTVIEAPFGMDFTAELSARAVDASGNFSKDSADVTIRIDRLPPPAPSVTVEGSTIGVVGTGTLYYRTVPSLDAPAESVVSTQQSPMTGYRPYLAPIVLPGEDGRRVEYEVTAVAVDAAGNTSVLSEARSVVINRRTPVVPSLSGLVDGGIYNVPRVDLSFREPDADLQLYYTVSRDGGEPLEPTTGDAKYDGSVSLVGETGKEIIFHVKVLPHYPGIARSGEVREFSFVLDNEPPQRPTIWGVQSGDVTSTAPVIRIEAGRSDDSIYYDLGQHDEVDALGPDGRVYSGPVEVSVGPNSEVRFALDVAVRDVAGNVTRIQDPVIFTVDTSPPSPPSIKVSPEPIGRLRFRGDVGVSIEGEGTIHYELASNGLVPPVPTSGSPLYEEPLLLRGVDGSVTSHSVAAIAVDDAGNKSDVAELLGVIIDLEAPPRPPEPTVRRVEEGGGLTIRWADPGENRLYYRVREEGDGVFLPYQGEVTLSAPRDEAVVEYYFADAVGNRGPLASTALWWRVQPAAPQLQGVADGSLYPDGVSIWVDGPGVVRYEIAVVPGEPAPVTGFSPVLGAESPTDNAVRIDVARGMTAQYIIRARRFVGELVSQPAVVTFTIDREPPDPPVLGGATSGAYYDDERTVTLSAAEGSIYVALTTGLGTNAPASQATFAPYQGPIELSAAEGVLASYTISAYTEDAAGNRSEPPQSWEIFIDKEVIYVSPDGSDSGEGSRSDPFASLGQALRSARRGGRSTIFLATGEYTVREPVEVRRDLSIVGGYDAESWQRVPEQRSTIRRVSGTSDTTALFAVFAAATLDLSTLVVEEAKGFWEAIIRNDEGAVLIADCRFAISGRSIVIHSNGGTIGISDTDFALSRTSAGAVIAAKQGVLDVGRVRVDLEDLVSPYDIFRLEDMETRIAQSSISASAGWSVRGIVASGGKTTLNDVTMSISDTREGVAGIAIVGGDLDVNGLSMTIRRSPYALGIRTDGGLLELNDAVVDIAYVEGATGLIVRNASVWVSRTRLWLTDISRFGYAISAGRSRLSLGSSALLVESPGEAVLFVSDESDTWIAHVTGVVRGAPLAASGIAATGTGRFEALNTILIGPGSGAAVSLDERVVDGGIVAANLSGWSTLRLRRGDPRRITTVDELNDYYRAQAALGNLERFEESYAFDSDELFATSVPPLLRRDAPVADLGIRIDGWPASDLEGEPLPRSGTDRDIGADELHPSVEKVP